MRRIFVLFFILAACLVVAPAALAAPKACDTGETWFDFGLRGARPPSTPRTARSPSPSSKAARACRPRSTCWSRRTRTCSRRNDDDRTCIELADIVAGDEVMILGWTDDSSGEVVHTAAAVSVKAPCFGLVGTVTAVDADQGLLTVSVDEATGDLTGEIQIVVTDETRVVRAHQYRARHARRDGEEERLTLADVAVGDTVGVWGTVDKSGAAPVYTADRVSVKVPRFGLVGSVSEVDADGGALFVAIDHASGDLTGTIEVAITGDTELFKLADHEKTAITLADVAAGDKVAVFGTIDLSAGEAVYTAHVLLDGVSADMLPKPACKPGDAAVKRGDAQKGDRLKLRIKVADAMPGCPALA